MLSDFARTTAEKYGVLNTRTGFANRTTFVIDQDGKIQHIEEGGSAIDPNGALEACSRLKR
jgi:peroxiredoxin Q/BCP